MLSVRLFPGSCSPDRASRNDTANVANSPKTTIFNWHIDSNHDFHRIHPCTDQKSKLWQYVLRVIGPINCQHFQRTFPVSASMTPEHPKVDAPEGRLETVTICQGNKKQTVVIFCALYSPYNYWCLWTVISGVVLHIQKRLLYQLSTRRFLFFWIALDLIHSTVSVGNLSKCTCVPAQR